MLDVAAICLVVTALLAHLNHRLTRLPTTISVIVIALALSLVMVGLDALGSTMVCLNTKPRSCVW